MFRNVLFLIEETALFRAVGVMTQELAEEGHSACLVPAGEVMDVSFCLHKLGAMEQETVMVTDSMGIVSAVQERGFPIVIILTPKNRHLSFSSISFALEAKVIFDQTNMTQVSEKENRGCGIKCYETETAGLRLEETEAYELENPGWDFFQKVYERSHKIPWTILETERLLVREIQIEDLDRLYEIYDQPTITDYVEKLYEKREEEEDYTRAYIQNMYGFYGYGIWVVIEKETGRPIGRAGIENHEDSEEVELGYLIAKECQRKGYAFEVCQAILDYAKGELCFDEIGCYVHPDNWVSRHLCDKLGFSYEGEKKSGDARLSYYKKKL